MIAPRASYHRDNGLLIFIEILQSFIAAYEQPSSDNTAFIDTILIFLISLCQIIWCNWVVFLECFHTPIIVFSSENTAVMDSILIDQFLGSINDWNCTAFLNFLTLHWSYSVPSNFNMINFHMFVLFLLNWSETNLKFHFWIKVCIWFTEKVFPYVSQLKDWVSFIYGNDTIADT